MLLTYAITMATACVFTVGYILVLRSQASRLGLVDAPHGRKTHANETPVVGGVAILLGLATAAIIGLWGLGPVERLRLIIDHHNGYLIGAFILFVTGLMDDKWSLGPRTRLLIQAGCCALPLFLNGTAIGDLGVNIGSFSLSLGVLTIPFTILVMLTITNAINMIDGIDGLAGGIVLAAFALMAKASMTGGLYVDALLISALIGAIVAFLLFNFPLTGKPASIFMGDAGSLFLGFTLAYLSVELSALPDRAFRPSTALWFFFLPVADTVWLCLRRTWFHRAPFRPGRDHIHHLLMWKFSRRTTAWILVVASAGLGAGGYLAARLGATNWSLIIAWVVLLFLYGMVTHKPWRRADALAE